MKFVLQIGFDAGGAENSIHCFFVMQPSPAIEPQHLKWPLYYVLLPKLMLWKLERLGGRAFTKKWNCVTLSLLRAILPLQLFNFTPQSNHVDIRCCMYTWKGCGIIKSMPWPQLLVIVWHPVFWRSLYIELDPSPAYSCSEWLLLDWLQHWRTILSKNIGEWEKW